MLPPNDPTLKTRIAAYRDRPTPAALDDIVHRCTPLIEHIAGRVCRRLAGRVRADRNELVQAASIRLLRAVDNVDVGDPRPFEAYLTKYARYGMFEAVREAAGEHRAARTLSLHSAVGDRTLGEFIADSRGTPAAGDDDVVNGLVGQLPPFEQRVYRLHLLERRDAIEVAYLLSSTLEKIRGTAAAVRRHIRQNLQRDADGDLVLRSDPVPYSVPSFVTKVTAAVLDESPSPEDELQAVFDRFTRDGKATDKLIETVLLASIQEEKARRAKRAQAVPPANPAAKAPTPPGSGAKPSPRTIDVMLATANALSDTMLDSFRLADGRKLGDATGLELEKHIETERLKTLAHRSMHWFYREVRSRTPDLKRVRDAITNEDVADLFQKAQAVETFENEPNTAPRSLAAPSKN